MDFEKYLSYLIAPVWYTLTCLSVRQPVLPSSTSHSDSAPFPPVQLLVQQILSVCLALLYDTATSLGCVVSSWTGHPFSVHPPITERHLPWIGRQLPLLYFESVSFPDLSSVAVTEHRVNTIIRGMPTSHFCGYQTVIYCFIVTREGSEQFSTSLIANIHCNGIPSIGLDGVAVAWSLMPSWIWLLIHHEESLCPWETFCTSPLGLKWTHLWTENIFPIRLLPHYLGSVCNVLDTS